MNEWVRSAHRAVMIDGCFLECHGRALRKLVPEEKVIRFDALRFHGKYGDVFLAEDVPEAERHAAARKVADAIVAALKEEDAVGL